MAYNPAASTYDVTPMSTATGTTLSTAADRICNLDINDYSRVRITWVLCAYWGHV